ncbi:ArsR/SmtB family transcription factor [Sphingomonas sp. UYP23]
MSAAYIFRVLGNERRLQILVWLRDPTKHFPPQVYGDLIEDGVCGLFIAEKLGISQSTLSEHMRLLVATGIVVPKRIKQWTFYRRDTERCAQLAGDFGNEF